MKVKDRLHRSFTFIFTHSHTILHFKDAHTHNIYISIVSFKGKESNYQSFVYTVRSLCL